MDPLVGAHPEPGDRRKFFRPSVAHIGSGERSIIGWAGRSAARKSINVRELPFGSACHARGLPVAHEVTWGADEVSRGDGCGVPETAPVSRAAVCPGCAPRLDDVLHRMRLRPGASAAEWLWAPVAAADGHAVLGPYDALTVHPTGHPQAGRVRARPSALPLPSKSVAALVVTSVLPVLPDLDGLFAELRRVLRPHGLISLLVPAGPPAGPRGRRLRADVRAHWAHRSAVDHPDWLVTAADFAVLGDDRLRFRAPDVTDPRGHVDLLCAAGLVPPGLPDPLRDRMAAHAPVAAGWMSLRRIVARR